VIPSGEQVTRMPQTHIIRKALTTPAGRLREGVGVPEYLVCMDTAAQIDAEGAPILTHDDAEALGRDVRDAARLVAILREYEQLQ
jgi:hypothetical protein